MGGLGQIITGWAGAGVVEKDQARERRSSDGGRQEEPEREKAIMSIPEPSER